MVKPDMVEFEISPLLKVTAAEPAGGFINVTVGPFSLINRAALPLKLTDSA